MFDLLFKCATIIDGTGAKPWIGDAAIAGDRVAALDRHIPGDARRVIAAGGYMLAPGFIDTDMTRALPDEQKQALLANIPLARLGQAEEIAAVVGFLASESAGYVTGETIHVNGGMYMA